MRTYPIMLDLRGRLCVVVGAGTVGLRRAAALRAAGGRVRLVGPAAGPRNVKGVQIVRGQYRKRHLAGARLVFACTDDRQLNSRIAADARAIGALVNVADQPEDCDFYVPSTFADGDVVLAVGTGGASPALAARLCESLARRLPARTGEFAAALGTLRQRLHKQVADPAARRKVMMELAGAKGRRAFARGGAKALAKLGDLLLKNSGK